MLFILTRLIPCLECVELCDDQFMRSTNLYGMSKRKWPELDSLFFKFQGPTAGALKETAAIVQRIAKKHGGSGFELAKNEREAAELWADRKNALYSGLALVPGSRGWSTDVWCVIVCDSCVRGLTMFVQRAGLAAARPRVRDEGGHRGVWHSIDHRRSRWRW